MKTQRSAPKTLNPPPLPPPPRPTLPPGRVSPHQVSLSAYLVCAAQNVSARLDVALGDKRSSRRVRIKRRASGGGGHGNPSVERRDGTAHPGRRRGGKYEPGSILPARGSHTSRLRCAGLCLPSVNTTASHHLPSTRYVFGPF